MSHWCFTLSLSQLLNTKLLNVSNRRGAEIFSALFLCFFIESSLSFAETNDESLNSDSPYSLKYEPQRKRGFILPPLASYVIPGFDQWVEEQRPWAFGYSGFAIGGYLLAAAQSKKISATDIESRNPHIRLAVVGLKTYDTAGGLSAFHSFRSAVGSRKDDFPYLMETETPTDLLLAPFRFSFLSRPTSYVPLGLTAGLLGVAIAFDKSVKFYGPTGSDALYSGVLSYEAGVGEEALFRGWMMPTWRYYLGSDFAANFMTSALFAAAHISSENRVPWIQFLFGYYFGHVSQIRGWTLSEGVFIHAWYDVMVFLAQFSTERNMKPTFQISPIQIPF